MLKCGVECCGRPLLLDRVCSHCTSLHYSARNGKVNACDILLKNGADADASGMAAQNALEQFASRNAGSASGAARAGPATVEEVVDSASGDVSEDNIRLVMEQAQVKRGQAIKALQDHGDAVDAIVALSESSYILLDRVCSVSGGTPLHDAAAKGDVATCDILLKYGADANAEDY